MKGRRTPPVSAPANIHMTEDLHRLGRTLEVRIFGDALRAGMSRTEAKAYAQTIMTYLGVAHSNFANRSSTLVTWEKQHGKPRYTFARHALPMTWDYAEVNPFGPSGWMRVIDQLAAALEKLPAGEGVQREPQATDL